MPKPENPFSELIHVLKHNGYTQSLLTEIPGPLFKNLLKKAGWDEAWSGSGETHILKRLRDPNRGPKCGILTLMDFARALESGMRVGPDQWISYRYGAVFIVNWRYRGFVTFIPLN
jgi:hypothetical protein